MRDERAKVEARVDNWTLTCWDGDPPKEGELKHPVRTVQGGDGLPTVERLYDSEGRLIKEIEHGIDERL